MKDERAANFLAIRKLLKKYEPPLVAKRDQKTRCELYSIKEVFFAGRERSEVFFAAVMVKKSYVGYYYMPVYTNPELKKSFKKELLSTLKGKSCFHIVKLDAILLKQIRESLALGFRTYRKNGWI